MESYKKKRERGPNFTKNEINLLVDLVVSKRHIFENKKTDAITWKEKDVAWNKLTATFNSQSSDVPRTAKCLRSKYETLKKDIRKKAAKKKVSMAATGGGIDTSEDLTLAEEKIYSLIQLSVDGLPSQDDDDAEIQNVMLTNINGTNLNDVEVIFEEPIVITEDKTNDNMGQENIENEPETTIEQGNWKKWKASMLRQPKSYPLQAKRRRQKTTKVEATQKVSVLASSKMDLIEIQTQAAKYDLDYRKEEDELKLKKIKLDLKNAEIELEIKKIEKEIKEQTLKKVLNSNSVFYIVVFQ